MFAKVSGTLCFCSHFFLKRGGCHKHLSIAFNKRKHASRKLFELLSLKNFIYNGKCEIFSNRKIKRRYQQINFVKNI